MRRKVTECAGNVWVQALVVTGVGDSEAGPAVSCPVQVEAQVAAVAFTQALIVVRGPGAPRTAGDRGFTPGGHG
ncbi:hypothetical protein ACWD04_21675 [Streptomyces sp. NPDC002911]